MKSRAVIAAVWTLCIFGLGSGLLQAAEPDLLATAKSGEASARLLAIDQLGLQGEAIEGAVPLLTELLSDSTASVRAHAAHSLGQIGETAKPAAAALMKLLADEEPQVRREAIRALRNIRPGPEVSIPLFTKLLKEASPEIRIVVTGALADAGKDVVPPMVEALAHPEASYWACLVLAEIGPDAAAAVPALTKLIQSDDRPDICREAIITLAAIGPEAASAVPALAELVAKRDEVQLGPAIYALGAIGPKSVEAAQSVREVADQEDTSPFVKTISLWTLARMNPEDEELVAEVVPHLVSALKGPNPQLRVAAARALLDLDPPAELTRPLIIKVMEEASPEVLHNILDALAGVGEKAVPRLIEALKVEEVRPHAAAIIARIGPPAKAAVPGLIEALGDENPVARSEVLYAIAAIGPDAAEAVPVVIEVLDDPELEVRYAACYALAQIGEAAEPAKAKLVEHLYHADRFLSLNCALTLARIAPTCAATAPKSVPILVRGLQSDEAAKRYHSAEALKQLGPLAKGAAAALKKATTDSDEGVRKAAAEALQAVAG